jgi:hypothetical protein
MTFTRSRLRTKFREVEYFPTMYHAGRKRTNEEVADVKLRILRF